MAIQDRLTSEELQTYYNTAEGIQPHARMGRR